MRNKPLYKLPAKADGSRYTLTELLDHGSWPLQQAYQQSNEMALAIQALQCEVEKAVAKGRTKTLLPASKKECDFICRNAWLDTELLFDPTKEKARVKNGELSWRTKNLRKAGNDPLLMARKRVIDNIPKPMSKIMGYLIDHDGDERKSYRNTAITDTQQLMMLMADNAVNHGPMVVPPVETNAKMPGALEPMTGRILNHVRRLRQDKPYALPELVAEANFDFAWKDASSYRMRLAVQGLQQIVGELSHDPTQRKRMLPDNDGQYTALQEKIRSQIAAIENNPGVHHAAKDDRLALACKHVLDTYFSDRGSDFDRNYSIDMTVRLVVLMADNEVNHKATATERSV